MQTKMASPESITKFGDSSLGHDFVGSPKEDLQEIKEVIIAVAGQSKAGKTSLANKILGREVEIELSLDPSTEKCEILSETQGGIKLTIIDNAREGKNFFHLLLYCAPVTPATKFKDHDPEMMKSLQSKFGKDIWKNCIIAFTFANHARRGTIEEYKEYIRIYAKMFEEELRNNLKVQDVRVKTIFELDQEQNLENVIIAVPVGDDDDDEVIPSTQEKWLDILRLQIVSKAEEERKLELQEYWNCRPTMRIAAGGRGAAATAVTRAGIGSRINAIVGALLALSAAIRPRSSVGACVLVLGVAVAVGWMLKWWWST